MDGVLVNLVKFLVGGGGGGGNTCVCMAEEPFIWLIGGLLI